MNEHFMIKTFAVCLAYGEKSKEKSKCFEIVCVNNNEALILPFSDILLLQANDKKKTHAPTNIVQCSYVYKAWLRCYFHSLCYNKMYIIHVC